MVEPITQAELETESTKILEFLEAWSQREDLKVEGVNILQALTYDLIQQLNNAYLAARLNGLEPTK